MNKRVSQHEDESAVEYLRRVAGNVAYEPESLLSQLPTVEAVFDYFDLWHIYGTDFWEGVIEGIADGEDPEPARAFVRKWKLGRAWLAEISDAVKLAKQPA